MPAVDQKFNVVGFSSNITNTINTATNRLLPSRTIASAGVTIDLNKKVGATIANPPLAPINSSVKNLANQTRELVKNPGGVLKNAANASFGKLTVQVNASLGQLRATLLRGITNCLRNAVSSLLRRIPFPNIPFGGIAVIFNKKLNELLNLEIILQADLLRNRINLQINLNKKFDVLKGIKSGNFYMSKLNGEINKEINKICNKISPRNQKMLSRGGPGLDLYASVATNSIINCMEKKIVAATSGFQVKAPTDFFNKATGRVSASIDKATGKVSSASEKLFGSATAQAEAAQNRINNLTGQTTSSIGGAVGDVNSAISKTTGAIENQVNSKVKTPLTKAYNSISNAISSNVPKSLTDKKPC